MSDLVSLARELESNISVRDRWYRLKCYRNCFVGSKAVEWLVKSGKASDVHEAVLLGNRLLNARLIHHVCDEHPFLNKYLFYEFIMEKPTFQGGNISESFSSNQSRFRETSIRDNYDTQDSKNELFLIKSTLDSFLPRVQQLSNQLSKENARVRKLEQLVLYMAYGYIAIALCSLFNSTLITFLISIIVATSIWAKNSSEVKPDFLPITFPSSTSKNSVPPMTTTFANCSTYDEFCRASGIGSELQGFIQGACLVSDILSSDQPIVFVNDAFVRMTGYSREEIIGINCRFLQGQETSLQEVEKLREIIRNKSEGVVELVNYTKTGKKFHNVLYLRPLEDPKNPETIRYMLGMQTDPNTPTTSPQLKRTMSTINSKVRMVVPDKNKRVIASVGPNGPLLPFETSGFKGVIHARARRDGDPYFANLRRYFEVQIQGVFTKQPEGVIWFGGEIDAPMRLGRVKKAVCNVLLKFISAFGRGMHVSFGSDVRGDKAHIVFPMWAAMDRVIITPPGQTPPPVGQAPLEETPELRQLKQSNSIGSDILVGHTYTMSFYNAYLDCENWSTVGLPGLGRIDLHTFWEDQPLHLVMYSVPNNMDQHLSHVRNELLHLEIVHDSLPRFREC